MGRAHGTTALDGRWRDLADLDLEDLMTTVLVLLGVVFLLVAWRTGRLSSIWAAASGAEALGIGDSYNALQSTACLGQDGMLYWLYGNSAFARIDPKTWEVYYQSGALIGSQGVVSMVPVVSTDGIQYVVLGVNNFTTPASFAVLNGYTGALTTTALGSGNGQIGGGQASDAITGELVCYSNFSQATNSLGIVPVNGTPSGFISKARRRYNRISARP